MFDPCFVMQYLVSFLFCNHFAEVEVYFYCLPGALLLLVFSGSSSLCRGLVCSV